MYKRHKLIIVFIFVVVFGSALALKADYSKIAESAIAVVSIALAVYIGAASVILGSDFAEKLKKQRDGKIKTKTGLGVLANYLRIAGIFSLVTVVMSTIYALDLNYQFIYKLSEKRVFDRDLFNILSLYISSISCGIFAINIVFIWLILIFLINSMTKSA